MDERDLTGKSYADLMRLLVGTDATGAALREAVAQKLSLSVDSHPIKVMDWLDLFSEEQRIPQLNSSTPLDALCDRMMAKMQYAPGERDMIVMQHTIVAEFPEKKKRQTITSKLIDYGIKVRRTFESFPSGFA